MKTTISLIVFDLGIIFVVYRRKGIIILTLENQVLEIKNPFIPGDNLHVQLLSCEVLHSGQHHQRQRVSFTKDDILKPPNLRIDILLNLSKVTRDLFITAIMSSVLRVASPSLEKNRKVTQVHR